MLLFTAFSDYLLKLAGSKSDNDSQLTLFLPPRAGAGANLAAMPGFEQLKLESKTSAAEAQKAAEKATGAAKAAALADWANALSREGQYQDAVARALEALDLWQELKDKKGKGCCFLILGRTHMLIVHLPFVKDLKDAAWQEASAQLLVAAAMARAGPGGAVAAAAFGLGNPQALRARRAAKEAAEAMQAASERRRQSLLRMSEAKVLMNQGDHEAALNCVADPLALAEGEPDAIGGAMPMCPADLGIGLNPEVRAALTAAVEVLSKTGQKALDWKANVLAIQGDLSAAKAAAQEAVAALKADAAKPQLNEKAEAVQSSDQAIQVAKGLSKSAQVSALCLSARIQLDSNQSQAALNLAGEEPLLQVEALCSLAQAQLQQNLPSEAVVTSQKVLKIFTSLNDTVGQVAAGCMVAIASSMLGEASAAQQAASEACQVALDAEDLGNEAGARLALLLSTLTNHRPKEALQSAQRRREALLAGGRDQAGEAAASLAVAQALLAQQSLEGALGAAAGAAESFKASCGVGQGVALCCMATVQLRMEDALEAEKSAKEMGALKRCSAVCGEARARQLLAHTQLKSLEPSSARVFFDEFNCAHLEISEMSSQDETVIRFCLGKLYALSSGNFLVGLRSLSIPIILAACGKIAGPSWQLVLGCDYRICSNDTDFLLPIISPPECLGELVGSALASQLCISSGTLDAQALQELNILNQVRPNKDETARAASELAKCIAGFPGIACRQTMSVGLVENISWDQLRDELWDATATARWPVLPLPEWSRQGPRSTATRATLLSKLGVVDLKYVATRATVSDLLWSSWPLPFILSQVSRSRYKSLGLRHWREAQAAERLAKEELGRMGSQALGHHLARVAALNAAVQPILGSLQPKSQLLWASVAVQGEWVQEAQLMDDLWSAAHKMAFLTMFTEFSATASSAMSSAADALARHETLHWRRKFAQLATLKGRTERRDPHSGVLAAAVPDESTVLATVLWTTRQSVEEKGFFAWPTAGGIWTASQLPGGVGPIYDWPKLLLWGLHYQKIIFLDADTLPITPDALERLASPLGTPSVHFVAVGFHEGREINNGVFALRPSQQLHRCLSRSAEAGTYFRGPFAEEFRRRGGTWMAFLDLFWQHEAFPCSGAQHVLVSQVFNFPASLGSIFQVRDARNQSSPRFVAEQWSKAMRGRSHAACVEPLHAWRRARCAKPHASTREGE
eukprot:g11189.t1